MNTKKITASFLACALMAAALPAFPASAAEIISSGECGDNASWTLDSEGTLTITGTGEMYDYETSSKSYSVSGGSVKVYSWTEDAVPWFEQRSNIKSIVVSEGIEKLGECVFLDCDSLNEVQLPDTLKIVGYEAFKHCDSLKSIELPDSVEEVYYDAFASCTELTDIKLSESLISIGYNSFGYCSELTDIVIPASVQEISNSAFYGCPQLTQVFIFSRSCEIFNSADVFSNGYDSSVGSDVFYGTIYGYSGSTAQTYAEAQGYSFAVLPELGDVNFDGAVDALDASLVLTEYAASATGQPSVLTAVEKLAADTDSDGNINSLDASYILSYYAHTATGGTGTFEEYMK